jgi:succinoglycan biosynthesis transport protein ExoP
MRNPQVGMRLGLPANAKGLSDLVAGTATLTECLHQVEGSPLLILPAGMTPPNPLELLLSKRFQETLASLASQVEVILIDSPPVELVSDALVLSPMAQSTIYVVKAMETPYPLARKGLTRLQRAGGRILGVVVNQMDFDKAQRYYGSLTGAGSYGHAYYGAGARAAESKTAA